MLTTDQGLVNDVNKAISKYQKRLEKQAAGEVVEDDAEERLALEGEKAIQEHIELPKKERRKVECDINGRFKRAVKEAAKNKQNAMLELEKNKGKDAADVGITDD